MVLLLIRVPQLVKVNKKRKVFSRNHSVQLRLHLVVTIRDRVPVDRTAVVTIQDRVPVDRTAVVTIRDQARVDRTAVVTIRDQARVDRVVGLICHNHLPLADPPIQVAVVQLIPTLDHRVEAQAPEIQVEAVVWEEVQTQPQMVNIYEKPEDLNH